MQLLDVAKELLACNITIEEAVYEVREEGDVMLRWFACDCAEHAMNWARKYRMMLDKRSLHALQVARELAAGVSSEEVRYRAAFAARDAARSDALHGISDSAKATVEVSPSYAAMAAAEAAVRAAGTFGRRADELEWQRHRFSYLCEVWAACGHRAHWLLWEGICPIEPPPEASL